MQPARIAIQSLCAEPAYPTQLLHATVVIHVAPRSQVFCIALIWLTFLQVLTQALWALTSIIEGSTASIEALVSAQGMQAILQQLSQLSKDLSGANPASPEATAAVAALLTTLTLLLSKHEGACIKFCDQVKHGPQSLTSI